MASMGVLASLMQSQYPRIDPYDPMDVARLTSQRTTNQTNLLTLEDLKRQQQAEAAYRQVIQHNPGLLFGGGTQPPLLASLSPGGMPPAGGPPGPITQQAFGPGGPGAAQQVPAYPDLSQFAGGPPPVLSSLAASPRPPIPASPLSPQATLMQLARQNPDAARLLQGRMQQQEDLQWKRQEQQLTIREKVAGYLARNAQTIRSQAQLDSFRADLQKAGLAQYAASLPEWYSEAAMAPLITSAQSSLENAQTALATAQAAKAQQQAQTEEYKRTTVLPKLLEETPTPPAAGEAPAAAGAAKPTGTQAAAPAEVETAVQEAVRLYPQVRPELVRAIIAQESNFDRLAKSKAGAQGYMQLMPGTAKEMGVEDPFDTKQNIRGGVRYVAQLLTKYGGDERQALAAYNAGPGAVDKVGGDLTKLPQETQAYVPGVLARAQVGATARGPATGPQVGRLQQQIAALEDKIKLANAGALLDPAMNTYADNLSKQLDRLYKERDRAEEIPRAAERKTAEAAAEAAEKRRQQGLPMLPEDRRKLLTGLRSDIRQEPTFKIFQDVRNGYQNVQIGAGRDSSEGDLALIYGLAKILDPGSVVRESEFATVAAAQGKLQQLLNTPQKFFEGDRLTPANRQKLLALAHSLAQEKLTTAQTELRAVYEPLAKEGNIAFGQLLPLEELKPLGTSASTPGSNLDKFKQLPGVAQ